MQLMYFKIAIFVCFTVAFVYLILTVIFGILSHAKPFNWKRSDNHVLFGKIFYGFTLVGLILAESMTWFWKSSNPDRHGLLFFIHLPCALTLLVLATLLITRKLSPHKVSIGRWHYFWGGLCTALFVTSFVLGNIMLYRY